MPPAEIALQLMTAELTYERHEHNRVVTSRDYSHADVERVMRRCSDEYSGARNEKDTMVRIVQLYRGEHQAAKEEKLRLETLILALMVSSNARSHDMPADIYTKGFHAGAGTSTDQTARTAGTRLRGIEEVGMIPPEPVRHGVPRTEPTAFASPDDDDRSMGDGNASVDGSWQVFPDDYVRDPVETTPHELGGMSLVDQLLAQQRQQQQQQQQQNPPAVEPIPVPPPVNPVKLTAHAEILLVAQDLHKTTPRKKSKFASSMIANVDSVVTSTTSGDLFEIPIERTQEITFVAADAGRCALFPGTVCV